MNEGDRWIYLDGPEPAHVRPLLDLLRRVPATAEENALFEREFFDRLDGPAPSAEGEQDEARDATTKPAPSVTSPPAQPMVVPKPPEPAAEAPAGVPRPPEWLVATAQSPPWVWNQKPAVEKRRGVGDRLPLGDDSIMRAVAACAAETAMPILIPTLAVNQYASLCAELVVTPERAGEILATYQVADRVAHRELNAVWAKRFEVEAGLRAEFEAKLAEFVAWLRVRRGWQERRQTAR